MIQCMLYVYCLVALAVDILSDMVQNSTFDEKEIEKERDIILKDMQVSHSHSKVGFGYH